MVISVVNVSVHMKVGSGGANDSERVILGHNAMTWHVYFLKREAPASLSVGVSTDCDET